ncbi:hypothetical protein AA0Y32_10625 [Georgenia phoenicis]|uniref:TolB family protein n=1 Tax=unclassified Georgenia TaxID=2626815 RepID=UPI0039AEDE8A
MRSPAPSPGTIGLTVLVMGVVLALLPGWLLPGRWFGPDATAGPAVIPARFADYSYLTGSVSASPPGRAVAVYQHGFGVELLDFPQAVVAGADGEGYRRLDAAEGRGAVGDAGPMLLSPDGTRVAVGRWQTAWPDVVVVDLATGRSTRHVVPGAGSDFPLAWSPDSTLLAYARTEEAADPWGAGSGELGLLDLTTGEARTLPDHPDVMAAAFSPDGTELAVHRAARDADRSGVLEVLDRDGAVLRTLPFPDHHVLDGPWSPDGRLLAVTAQGGQGRGTAFVDAAGTGAPVPARVPGTAIGWDGLLGWTRAGEALFLDTPDDPAATDLYWLTAVPLDGGEPQRLSAVPGGGNYGVAGFQLATGLLPEAQVRDTDVVTRGLWPTGLRLAVAAACAALATAAAGRLVRRTPERSGRTSRSPVATPGTR